MKIRACVKYFVNGCSEWCAFFLKNTGLFFLSAAIAASFAPRPTTVIVSYTSL